LFGTSNYIGAFGRRFPENASSYMREHLYYFIDNPQGTKLNNILVYIITESRSFNDYTLDFLTLLKVEDDIVLSSR
jgi:hypothetical protein